MVKKPIVVMVATIVYAVSGVIIGQHDVNLAAMMILGALGLGGMRDAVRKLEK